MALDYKNRAPRAKDTTPVDLTTGPTPLSLTITAAKIPGPPVTLPSSNLMNTLGAPIEVTELSFTISEPVQTPVPSAAMGTLSSGVEISLALGGHQLTREFCPVRPLGVRRDSIFFESASFVGLPVSPLLIEEVRWIFSQPLILAPNEGFSGQLRLSSVFNPYPVTGAMPVFVAMVARGRRLPTGTSIPRVRSIPYASGFLFTAAGVPGPSQLLQNRFASTLHVTAMNALTNDGYGNFPAATSTFYKLRDDVIVTYPGGLASSAVRTFRVPAACAFGGRFSIEEPFDLDKGQAAQIAFSNPGGFADALSSKPIPATVFAMTGWREE